MPVRPFSSNACGGSGGLAAVSGVAFHQWLHAEAERFPISAWDEVMPTPQLSV